MGALIVGFVLVSFIMLPFIALIAIAGLVYYLLTKRGRRGKKVPSEGSEETVNSDSYTVLEEEENDPSSNQDLNGTGIKEIPNDLH